MHQHFISNPQVKLVHHLITILCPLPPSQALSRARSVIDPRHPGSLSTDAVRAILAPSHSGGGQSMVSWDHTQTPTSTASPTQPLAARSLDPYTRLRFYRNRTHDISHPLMPRCWSIHDVRGAYMQAPFSTTSPHQQLPPRHWRLASLLQ